MEVTRPRVILLIETKFIVFVFVTTSVSMCVVSLQYFCESSSKPHIIVTKLTVKNLMWIYVI